MSDIVVLAAGERCISLAEEVRKKAAAQGMDFSIVNARFLKPLDGVLLEGLPQKHVITLEDNVVIGGLGDAIARFYRNSEKSIYSFGYGDAFIPHGTPRSLAEKYGLSRGALESLIKSLYARG